jgi:hypothetical protein
MWQQESHLGSGRPVREADIKKEKKRKDDLRQGIVDLDAELMEEGRSLTFCFLRLHASQA